MAEPNDAFFAPPSPPASPTTSQSPDAGPPTVDFVRTWHTLLKRAWLVGLVFALVVVGVAVWTFRMTPIYRAEASVVIDPSAPQVLKNVPEVVETGTSNFWSAREYFETQYRILKSRGVADKVVQRLGLDHDRDFLRVPGNLEGAALAEALKNADPAKMVMERVVVAPVKDSRVVLVSIEDASPQRATDLANAIAEEYIEQNVDRKLTTTHSASAWLAEQLTSIRKRLEDSEKGLYQFKQDHDVLTTSLEARQNISTEKLVQMSDALTKTQLRRAELEAKLQSLQDALALPRDNVDDFTGGVNTRLVDNILINDLKREYFRLQSERAELSEKYLEAHPKRIALEERITKVKQEIRAAIQTVVDSVQADYKQALDEERRQRGMLESAKHDALAVNQLELKYSQLKRERDQNQSVYDVLVKRQKEVDVAGLLKTNNIRLLDPALVPRTPVRPNRPQNLLIAMILGLALGVGLVLLIDMLDTTVKSQEDVESVIGLPLLGILPSIPLPAANKNASGALQERDLYVSRSPTSAVSECARAIRTSLLFSSPDRPFKVLLVASTGPREGKTTTATSIAITMAQSGNRVLLVDGDLRRPRLHRTFGVPSSAGLSTMILGESSIDDSVKSTGIDGMFILPAGPVPPNPAELLQSSNYGEVLKKLGAKFDRIIIDSAPVGVVSDALVMSSRADGLVLVLRSGVTPKKAAWRGKRAFLDVKAHIYGAVLNDVDLGSRAGQYYYYYRYGYYPTEQQEAATKSS